MKPTVWIHTNQNQWIGAKLAEFALRRASARPDAFDIQFLHFEEQKALTERHGQFYQRGAARARFRSDAPQSFALTRFLPPQLMNYQGRALLIDPDVFAVTRDIKQNGGDAAELFERDMGDHAILARPDSKTGHGFASSVMLLDCARLKHWEWEKALDELFAEKRNYAPWMSLELEPAGSVGPLEPEYNSFDTLDEKTRFLHFTNRKTQPWKVGLSMEAASARTGWKATREKILGAFGKTKDPNRQLHLENPDEDQNRFFFQLAKDALEAKAISRELVDEQIGLGYLRPDFWTRLAQFDMAHAA